MDVMRCTVHYALSSKSSGTNTDTHLSACSGIFLCPQAMVFDSESEREKLRLWEKKQPKIGITRHNHPTQYPIQQWHESHVEFCEMSRRIKTDEINNKEIKHLSHQHQLSLQPVLDVLVGETPLLSRLQDLELHTTISILLFQKGHRCLSGIILTSDLHSLIQCNIIE